MSIKKRLVVISCSIVLVAAIVVIGVFASPTQQFRVGGKISFSAPETISAKIYTKVSYGEESISVTNPLIQLNTGNTSGTTTVADIELDKFDRQGEQAPYTYYGVPVIYEMVIWNSTNTKTINVTSTTNTITNMYKIVEYSEYIGEAVSDGNGGYTFEEGDSKAFNGQLAPNEAVLLTVSYCLSDFDNVNNEYLPVPNSVMQNGISANSQIQINIGFEEVTA